MLNEILAYSTIRSDSVPILVSFRLVQKNILEVCRSADRYLLRRYLQSSTHLFNVFMRS